MELPLETVLALGSYCEQLIGDPNFQYLSALFEQTAVAEMLATKPHETKLRESIYARITAHREFLSLFADMIDQRRKAETPMNSASIDDPDVHDIYRQD